MAGTKLLPCPFCGGKAHIWNSGYFYSGKCYKCGCTLSGSGYVTEAEAIAAWNTRADDYRQAAEYWQRMYEQRFVERTCKLIRHGSLANMPSFICWSCSECGFGWHHSENDKQFSYCPNCGAKVVSE